MASPQQTALQRPCILSCKVPSKLCTAKCPAKCKVPAKCRAKCKVNILNDGAAILSNCYHMHPIQKDLYVQKRKYKPNISQKPHCKVLQNIVFESFLKKQMTCLKLSSGEKSQIPTKVHTVQFSSCLHLKENSITLEKWFCGHCVQIERNI